MRRQRGTSDRPAAAERTVNACRRCRQRKVKCSGVAPCRNCASRRQHCVFDEADKRIVISERHLRDLERRARPRPASHRDSGGELEESHCDGSFVVNSNPGPSDVTHNSDQKGLVSTRHLATWDFSQQLRKILGVELNDDSLPSGSYKIPLQDEAFLDSLESAFPPKNYIIHLAHVVDFHANTNYCLFSITAFIDQLNKVSLRTISGTFKVKLSLVVALGKLFLEKGATVFGPPGVKDFLKALRDFQLHIMVDEDPFTTVECLCLLATYAQAADMHRMAYLYIGQASRISRAWKLDCCDGDIEPVTIKHAPKLWLTVRTLDQRLSATIDASPDNSGFEEQPGMLVFYPNDDSNVEVRLNLAIANILTRVVKVFSQHGIEDALTSLFINKIITELGHLQSLVEHMKIIQPLCATPSLLATSRQVATLYLLFCHCVMVATRPVLLGVTKLGLQEQELTPENALFETVFKMIRTCINAANCTLSVISALYEQNLLENFIFLDMEMTFLASLCLTIANKICPNATESYYFPLAQNVLQDMCHTGSIPAGQLQKELNYLHGLIVDHNTPTFHQLVGRNNSLSFDTFLDKRINLVQNGLELNNAIFDVIDIDFSAASSPESSAHPLSTRTGLDMNSIPAQASHEVHMDGLDPVNTSFSFDMEDLQWLDCVQ